CFFAASRESLPHLVNIRLVGSVCFAAGPSYIQPPSPWIRGLLFQQSSVMLHEHLAPCAQNHRKHKNRHPLPATHKAQRYFQAFGAEHRFSSLHPAKKPHLFGLTNHFCDNLAIPAGRGNRYENVYPQKTTNSYPGPQSIPALLEKHEKAPPPFLAPP